MQRGMVYCLHKGKQKQRELVGLLAAYQPLSVAFLGRFLAATTLFGVLYFLLEFFLFEFYLNSIIGILFVSLCFSGYPELD